VAGHVHRYTATTTWRGTTAVGYDAYDRDHEAVTPEGAPALRLSGDAAFGGSPARTNPEQLLVAAASSCQLLSFLARAARARLDVVAYEDAAEGEMPEDDEPLRIVSILLRPRITVAAGTNLERVRKLVMQAHGDCFIANSLTTNVVIEPELVEAP
jgi:organic hydroperoxide reductase OsmC/OhrA